MHCDHERRMMPMILKPRHQRRRLLTTRRLLQSSAEEDARTIPQLQLHPRLGTKK